MKQILFKMIKGLSILLLVSILIIVTAATVRLIIREYIRNQRAIKTPYGIDKELIIQAGGINQFIHIRGKDTNNPVILVLHGGPGSPMTALQHKYQEQWEENFTVVNWDQRNAGKTYFLNNPKKTASTVSMEQAVKDTLDVVKYLQKSLKKDKIIILGHSYGSILGTLFVQQYPKYVSAYIGAGQQISLKANEDVQHKKLMELIREKDLKELETIKAEKEIKSRDALIKEPAYQNLIGKYLRYSVNGNVALYALMSPYYTLEETNCYTLNTQVTQKGIMDYFEQKGFDAARLGMEYKMPVFYILGDHDYITPYTIAQDFFEEINAPYKDSVVLENAGHMMMLDAPEAFAEFLNNDVLGHVK